SRTKGPPSSDNSSDTVNECAATTEIVRRSCSFCPLAVTGSTAKRIEIGLVQSPLLGSATPPPTFLVKLSVFAASSKTITRLSLNAPPSCLHSLAPSTDFPSARFVKVTTHSRGAGHRALSRPMYL